MWESIVLILEHCLPIYFVSQHIYVKKLVSVHVDHFSLQRRRSYTLQASISFGESIKLLFVCLVLNRKRSKLVNIQHTVKQFARAMI